MDGSLPIDGLVLVQLFVTKGKPYNSRARQRRETDTRWVATITINGNSFNLARQIHMLTMPLGKGIKPKQLS